MIELEFGLLIDRPVSQVYAFLSNPLNLPRWQANVKEIKALSPGTVGPSSALTVRAASSGGTPAVSPRRTGARGPDGVRDGRAGPGSLFSVTSEMLGRHIEGKMEIVEMEADQSFAFKMAAGPVRLDVRASFKTVGTGTRLSFSAQGEPGGLFKLAEGVLAGQVRSQMEANLARLKAVLESGA